MEKHKDFEAAMEAYMESQKEIYHTPINLGINEFKRKVRIPFIKVSTQNKLIKAFKKRAWMEYEGIARHRGNFPVHLEYGKALGIETEETETKVKVNGKTKA